MPTEVLYRKWRPQRFADVAGQDVLTRTLINALSAHKVSHAYLFAGPRGTGKTTTARLLAKAINCEKNAPTAKNSPGEPCNECGSCLAFGQGSSLDLVEMDGASNRGIDNIRELRENTNFMPMGGMDAHKVYLIDEVHMLTEPAFNALLKTLEEPPPHVIFILATTDSHKVPATIVSRCQRHEFKRIPVSAMADRLAYIASQEGIDVPREGFEMIARTATGSLRDAINLLEQVCDSYGKEASIEAVREGLGLNMDERSVRVALHAVRGDLGGGLQTIGEVRDDGLDLRQFQKEIVLRLREYLLVQAGAVADSQWTPEQLAEMKSATDGVPRERLVRALRAFGQADLRADPLSPLPLELALADAVMEPVAPAARADAAPASRPAPQQPRGAPPRQQYAPSPAPRPAPAPTPSPSAPMPPTGGPERVPEDLRKDLSKASAEDIARMLGSKAPVIPRAPEHPEEPIVAATTANGAPGMTATPAGTPAASSADGDIDLPTLVTRLYAFMKPTQSGLAAFINGSCHAISLADGVLTLGFPAEFHKGKVSEAKSKPIYEQMASQMLGVAVTIRCIMAEKPANAMSKSPLVQHAVQSGAKIISGNEEP